MSWMKWCLKSRLIRTRKGRADEDTHHFRSHIGQILASSSKKISVMWCFHVLSSTDIVKSISVTFSYYLYGVSVWWFLWVILDGMLKNLNDARIVLFIVRGQNRKEMQAETSAITSDRSLLPFLIKWVALQHTSVEKRKAGQWDWFYVIYWFDWLSFWWTLNGDIFQKEENIW